MKSTLYLCLIIGLGSVAHSHYHHNGHENKHNLTNISRAKLHPTILNFGIQIHKHCASTSPGKNVFFSPISIATTLSLLSLGAKSVTHDQIVEGLGFNLTEVPEKHIHEGFHSLFYVLSRADDQILIDLGQALFLKEDLKPQQEFLHDVDESYEAEVKNVNFQEPNNAEKLINDYEEKKTHGKITELVKSLDPETAMVIVNYIFFKGNWKRPFEPELTSIEDFFVNNETIVKVPMMSRLGWFHYYFDAEHSCTVVRMDYNSSATALFILPDEGKFKQVEDAFSVDTVTKWLEHTHRVTADVHLPRFTISTTHELKEPLKRLGIDIFSNRTNLSGIIWVRDLGQTAEVHMPRFTISTTHELKEPLNRLGIDIFSDQTDLSGITGARDLKVSKVTHKAVLTVNEKGTEAAGATAVEIMPMSLPPTTKFNRPFFMVILETSTNVALFIGSVINPTES